MLLPIYQCTSDTRVLRTQVAQGLDVALTSYLGVSGVRGDNSGGQEGVLTVNRRIKFAEISDGLSNTLMVAERPPSTDMVFGWWFAGAGYDDSGTGDVVLGAREFGYLSFVQSTQPCLASSTPKIGLQPGTLENPCDQAHFWSLHPNGTNALFCDGSVHFLTYAADSVLPALTTRAGGEDFELP
jgi:prepilin-type processing-associated H-X9-DG protein